MAVNFDYNSGTGNAVITADPGTNSTLSISVSGGVLSLTLSGETWTKTGDGTWSYPGATLSGSSSQITGSLTVDLNNGTNVCNLKSSSFPIVFAPTAGTNTLNIGNLAPTLIGSTTSIGGSITVSPTGGTTAVAIDNYSATWGINTTVTNSSISNILSASGYSVNYSGTYIASVRLVLNNSTASGREDTCTISSTIAATTIDANGGVDTVYVRSNQHTLTINSAAGNDLIVLGTTAGSSAGCDGITSALTIAGGAGNNTLRLDDTGSATGNKTITITPAATQAGTATVTGLGSATISWTASGGNMSGELRFDGSSIGGNTFVIAAEFLDNAAVYGNGSNNTLDVSALPAGWTDNGSSTITQNNGKTITYSGVTVFPTASLNHYISKHKYSKINSTNMPNSLIN